MAVTRLDFAQNSTLEYDGNPKTKLPWVRNARGPLCPSEVDGTVAADLLRCSSPHPERPGLRYAVHNDQAFEAIEHRVGVWHGHPVAWHEVPPGIRREWVDRGLVSPLAIRADW